jgi:O-antigen/teichoic acid export membrane protein
VQQERLIIAEASQPAVGLTNRLSLVKDRFLRDDMARDGLIMVVFGLLAGFFNYLYQISMGVMLTPADFGTLFSLFSLFMIVWWLSQALQTPMTKFVSTFKAQGTLGKASYLWNRSLRGTLIIGLAVFVVSAAFSPLVSKLLRIDNSLYAVLLFSGFILAFAVPVNNGTLRGLQRFAPSGFSNTLLAFVRFSLAVLLVSLGLGIYGGLLPIVLAYCAALLVSTYFLRGLARVSHEPVKLSSLRSYTGLSLIAMVCFAMLTNVDVVLAKHYLDSDTAGIYSAVSVLGRVALFAPAGIAVAMFPKASEFFETGRAHGRLLQKAMLYVLLIGGAVVAAYVIFPNFVIDFLLRGKYDIAAIDLVKYAIAMLFFAVSFLLINYLLALNRTKKVAYCLLAVAAFQVSLMVVSHSGIHQLVNIMLVSSCLCLLLILPLSLEAMGDAKRTSEV